MIHWTDPTNAHRGRPIDRPAVAIIITVAMFLAALLGLYVAHVTTPHPTKVESIRVVPHIEPICRTYHRGHGTTTRVVPRVACHVTTTSRGTV
jgi:hypothetical protein